MTTDTTTRADLGMPAGKPDYPLWLPMTFMPAFAERGITIVEGEGVTVRDRDGKEYLSATSGLWNVSCGWGHPRIIAAITRQLERLSYGTLFRYDHEPAVQLARRLVDITPDGLSRVFFTTGGAAAVETALKVVRRYFGLIGEPQRRLVVSLDQLSWHGTLYGSMAVSGFPLEQLEYGADLSLVRKVPFPSDGDRGDALLDLTEREGDRIAAIILEPVLASSGARPLPEAFVRTVQDVCRRHGILLILDEVATGFGRTGRMFASELYDLQPDVLALSKGINSGYLPLGATLFREELYDAYQRTGTLLFHGETQGGNPAACAAALATLDVLEDEELVGNAAAVGGYLLDQLQELRRHPHVGDVRGIGLLLGVDIVRSKSPHVPSDLFADLLPLVARCAAEGLLVHLAPEGIALLPPLVLGERDADRIVAVLDRVLGDLRLNG